MRIIRTGKRELHMVGEYACVAWHIKTTVSTIYHENKEIKTTTFIKTSKPYIDFVYVCEDDWVNEDSPVDGGMSFDFAIQIRDELTAAIDYLVKITGQDNNG